ncbi:hypothetical protein S83_012795, partial [Arachis hypogaea]
LPLRFRHLASLPGSLDCCFLMDFLLPRTSIELYVLASVVHQIFPRLVVWLAFHQMALRLCKTLLDSTKRTLNIIFNNAGYAESKISRTIKGKRTPPACKENRSTGELSFLTSLMNSVGSMGRQEENRWIRSCHKLAIAF